MKFNNVVLGTVCAIFLCSNAFADTPEAPAPCVPCVPCQKPVPVKKKVKRVRVKKPVPAPIVRSCLSACLLDGCFRKHDENDQDRKEGRSRNRSLC